MAVISCHRGKRETLFPLCVKEHESVMIFHSVVEKLWALEKNVTFDSVDWS